MSDKATPAELRALVDKLTAHNIEREKSEKLKQKERNINGRDEKRKA